MSCGAPTAVKSLNRESGISIAGCRLSTAASTSATEYAVARGARSRSIRNANSASATRMWLAPNGTVPPFSNTRSRSSRPASGPSTAMCAWPALLVAAIFQPYSGAALRASSRAWMA